MAPNKFRFRDRVVLTDEKLPWFQARRSVAAKGGLPAYALLDRVRCDESYRRTLPPSELEKTDRTFSIWAREIVVYPARGTPFRPEESVSDPVTKWVFPAHSIPAEVHGHSSAVLLVVPDGIRSEAHVTVLESACTTPVFNIVQDAGIFGMPDPKTRVPVEVPSGQRTTISDADKRWLSRSDGGCVRPIALDYLLDPRGPQGIELGANPNASAHAAYVTKDFIELRADGSLARVLVPDVSMLDLGALRQNQTPSAFIQFSPKELVEARLAAARVMSGLNLD